MKYMLFYVNKKEITIDFMKKHCIKIRFLR